MPALGLRLIALPMTLIIITGEIDLSVASIVGMSTATIGSLTLAGWEFLPAAGAAVVVGTLGGVLNGVLIAFLGLPSLAVTIGTLALYRGLASVTLGPRAISDFPAGFTAFGFGNIPGTPIPWTLVVFAASRPVTSP